MERIFLLVVVASLVSCSMCQPSPDPWCANMNCPAGQVCRILKPCPLTEQCNITAICTATTAQRPGCLLGDPILVEENGALKDLICYAEAPCPNNAYCSTLVMDVSSICCHSNPVPVVKPGSCPNVQQETNRYFCYDECQSDSDCSWNEKCCQRGCKKDCMAPAEPLPPTQPPTVSSPDPCDTRRYPCPMFTYCLRRGEPCPHTFCPRAGSCVPCETVRPTRGFNIIMDPSGCPALVPRQASRNPARPSQVNNMSDFLTFLWFLNGQ